MKKTLQDILIDANSYLDLSAEVPTGTELNTRINFADRAVREAASTDQMREFKRVYVTNTSTLATIPLPADFRELQTAPYIMNSSGSWVEYVPIEPEAMYEQSTSDYWCYLTGNRLTGYYLYFNQMISMATLSITYQAYPTGFATLSDVCELDDEEYVVERVESLVLESRSDDRFQIKKADVEKRLSNMIGRGNKPTPGGTNQTKKNFTNPLA